MFLPSPALSYDIWRRRAIPIRSFPAAPRLTQRIRRKLIKCIRHTMAALVLGSEPGRGRLRPPAFERVKKLVIGWVAAARFPRPPGLSDVRAAGVVVDGCSAHSPADAGEGPLHDAHSRVKWGASPSPGTLSPGKPMTPSSPRKRGPRDFSRLPPVHARGRPWTPAFRGGDGMG